MFGLGPGLEAGYQRFRYAVHKAKEPPRSPHWSTFRRMFLAKHQKCAACGTTDHVEAHHAIPFHLDPPLELEESNLIALCLSAGKFCHLRIGHGNDYHSFNPNVRADAATVLADGSQRAAIEARALMARKQAP